MIHRFTAGVSRAGIGAFLCFGGLSTAGHAQTTTTPLAEQVQEPPVTDVGEIIVTAQRRSERLKDVPISIAAFSAEELQSTGVTVSKELQNAVPGLQIQATGGFVQPNIRGIGTVQSSAGSESNIALYIDGVYMPNQTASVFGLTDLESIQVLKGPQGSLYGRNATGGAILVTTRRPSDDFQLEVNAGYGRFDDVQASAYVTGPLGATLKGSLSALYHDDGGFGYDVRRKVPMQTYNEVNVRGKLLWEPSSRTSVLFSGDYGRVDDITTISLKILNRNTNVANAFIPSGPHNYATSFTPVNITDNYGGSIVLEQEIGDLALKSISAYRHFKYQNMTDNDRLSEIDTRFQSPQSQNTYSQELTLSSDSAGKFRWIVGAYYIDDTTKTVTNSINGPVTTLVAAGIVDAKAISVFAEGTYDITTRLSLLLGGRYSSEKRTLAQRRPTGTPLTIFQGETQAQFTPKVSLLYRVTDEANIYATYNKGFKSGGFVANAFGQPITRPETIDGYEVGLKYSSRGVSFNSAAFYYIYKDIQFNSRLPSGLSTLQNAAEMEIYGLDAELIVPLTSELRLRASGAYTHAVYTNFTNPIVLVPRNPDGTGGNAAPPFPVDVSGNRAIRTPEFTANLGLTYTKNVGPGDVRFNGSVSYNSGFPWLPEGRVFQKEYALVNAEISWSPNDGSYRASLWGKNLTNVLYSTSTSLAGVDAIAYAKPISYGVTLSFSFR